MNQLAIMKNNSPDDFRMFSRLIFAFLLAMACASAMTWQDFTNLPLEQKFILQDESLRLISEGQLSNSHLSRSEATTIRNHLSIMVRTFSTAYPDDYKAAVSNVKKIMNVTPPPETKYVKVGANKYVSESICKTNPEECVDQTKANTSAAKVAVAANKRTPEQCKDAREKDWQVYCGVLWGEGFQIDCGNPNPKSKAEIQDQLAQSLNSYQAICLRGD